MIWRGVTFPSPRSVEGYARHMHTMQHLNNTMQHLDATLKLSNTAYNVTQQTKQRLDNPTFKSQNTTTLFDPGQELFTLW